MSLRPFVCVARASSLCLLLAPHTNGPRDALRCELLSLLQKPLHYRKGSAEIAPTLNVKLWDPVVTGGGVLPLLSPIIFSDLLEPSRTFSNLVRRTYLGSNDILLFTIGAIGLRGAMRAIA
jgi:hypothetical protein